MRPKKTAALNEDSDTGAGKIDSGLSFGKPKTLNPKTRNPKPKSPKAQKPKALKPKALKTRSPERTQASTLQPKVRGRRDLREARRSRDRSRRLREDSACRPRSEDGFWLFLACAFRASVFRTQAQIFLGLGF